MRALIVGANRGIGLGVVKECLARGWDVVATIRQPDRAAPLEALKPAHPGRLDIRGLNMSEAAQIDGFDPVGQLDIALINAGVAGPAHRSANAVTPDEIGELMFVNAIGPIRLARRLVASMRPNDGVLAFTSSIMGSVALNAGGHELYRASKAALNSLSRGLFGELSGRRLTLLSLHPGWVRTDLGGSGAPVGVEESARGMVDVMQREKASRRHAFIDYTGKEIAW
jgi:NAD(P)-dependent dehydrogenase (short-subunit alcohol dehydrogenase family)